jgi:hypothetical protein
MIERRRAFGANRETEDEAVAPFEPVIFKPELIVRESSASPEGES